MQIEDEWLNSVLGRDFLNELEINPDKVQDPVSEESEPAGFENLEQTTENGKELPSVIWGAANDLVSPDLLTRIQGVEHLEIYNLVNQLPLIAYILCTRITEPDIELRARIVKILGGAAGMSSAESLPSEAVQKTLIFHLSRIRTREIFALLQVAEYDKSSEACVGDLLSCCSFAGSHLSQILSNRDIPMEIRCQATHFIGLLGYLDALPVLERLTSRYEGRTAERDAGLLIEMQSTVEQLTAL
jgi:hypothetical protein